MFSPLHELDAPTLGAELRRRVQTTMRCLLHGLLSGIQEWMIAIGSTLRRGGLVPASEAEQPFRTTISRLDLLCANLIVEPAGSRDGRGRKFAGRGPRRARQFPRFSAFRRRGSLPCRRVSGSASFWRMSGLRCQKRSFRPSACRRSCRRSPVFVGQQLDGLLVTSA